MNDPFEVLNAEELAVYKWQYNLQSNFRKCLWQTIILADDKNLERLWRAFPIDVGGYRKYLNEGGWWDELEKKVYGETR